MAEAVKIKNVVVAEIARHLMTALGEMTTITMTTMMMKMITGISIVAVASRAEEADTTTTKTMRIIMMKMKTTGVNHLTHGATKRNHPAEEADAA